MPRKNTLVFIVVLILFALALSVVLPIDQGVLGERGMRLGLDLEGGIRLVYKADFSAVEPGMEAEAIDGAVAIIERRINVLGVTEPTIQKLDDDSIMVELPGISETEKARKLIGQTALLEFRELVTQDGETEWVPATAVIDGQEKVLTSAYFKENTYVDRDTLAGILLIFEWNEEGSKLSEQITGRLINKPLGIFLSDEPLLGEDGEPIAPIVRSKITHRGQIEGLSLNEATELSKLLNAGRIPLPLTSIYEESVSPTLGTDFVDMSVKAGVIGIILVLYS